MSNVLIFYFELKRRALYLMQHASPVISEEDIAVHSIIVRGINTDLSIEQAQECIQSIFK